MSRVAVVVALTAAVLAAGCSPSIGNPVRILPCTPSEDRLDKQMVRMAQSVPTASAVPCMRAELDDWFLDDLGSLNGTYVNRRRIESERLGDGDELQVGKYKLTFLSR